MREARWLMLLALLFIWSVAQENSPPSATPKGQISNPLKLPGYRFEKKP